MVFFDDLVEPFYVKLGADFADPAKFRQGQIFFAVIPYSDEQKQYWRPVAYDKLTSTTASQFNIVGGGTDLFKRALPLHTPKLEVNEEFVVVRAKRRPVVMVATPGSGALARLSKHHLVIPRYGAVKGNSDQPKLTTEIVTRIRTLEYPDLMFSPSLESVLSKDGFLAGHLLQPIPLSRLDPTQYALGPQALTAFRGQIMHRCFGVYEREYAEWREMLLDPGNRSK